MRAPEAQTSQRNDPKTTEEEEGLNWETNPAGVVSDKFNQAEVWIGFCFFAHSCC